MCEQNVRGDHSFLQLNQFILHHGVLRKVQYRNKHNLDSLPVWYIPVLVTRSDQLFLQILSGAVPVPYPVRFYSFMGELFFQYFIQHCFICRPSDSTVPLLVEVQEKAVKMVSGLRSKEFANRCAELGLETLEQRRQNQGMGLVYKLLNGEEESNLFTLANRPRAVKTRQTAGTKSIVAKFARTDQRKFSFSVRTVEKWNGLSETTKQAATQDGFKRSLKQTRQ